MEYFQKIFIADIDKVSKKVKNSFLMCGNTNWDYYFTQKDNKTDYEELKNIYFINFDTEKEFENFIFKNDIIDYSLEDLKYIVLHHAKN